MGDDLIELVKAMAEDVAVDLTELGSGFVTVEEPENPPLGLTADSAHIWFAMELIVTSSNCYLTVKKRVLQRLTISNFSTTSKLSRAFKCSNFACFRSNLVGGIQAWFASFFFLFFLSN